MLYELYYIPSALLTTSCGISNGSLGDGPQGEKTDFTPLRAE